MSFRAGDRGQSIQVGAVLIFGLVIVLFSSYQAFVVPSQNQGIEFNHHQDVERDMVEVRAELLQAKTTGEKRFATVQLGTEFPSRIIARNPPSPGGTLRTTDNRTLRVDVPGETRKLSDWFNGTVDENRFITYSPDYSEYREGGPIRYENSVVYTAFDEGNVVATGQRLLRNDTISLVPVHREFQASGRQSVPVEPVPSRVQTQENVVDPNITVGTELDNETWVDIFEDEIDAGRLNASDINVTTLDGERVLQLNLTGEYDIEFSPVGLDRAPRAPEAGEADESPGDPSGINPAEPGDIQLVAADWINSNRTVKLSFKNNGSQNTSLASGRLAFYEGKNQNVVGVYADGTQRADNLPWSVPGSFENLNPNIDLVSQERTSIIVDFTGQIRENQDWFVIEFRLETGETVRYFIGGSFDSSN